MRSPSRIWPDLSGSRLFRRSARSCSISRIYSSQVVTRASAGAGLRRHHYAACQSIRLDRSRNGPNGNSNIPCATEAPSAIRAPTVGAPPLSRGVDPGYLLMIKSAPCIASRRGLKSATILPTWIPIWHMDTDLAAGLGKHRFCQALTPCEPCKSENATPT
jgi:hypothetical protein